MLAGPFVGGNFQMFGSFAGPVSRSTLSTDLTARAALGNVIRSIASEFQIGDGGHAAAKDLIHLGV